jgi:hypothetical protein
MTVTKVDDDDAEGFVVLLGTFVNGSGSGEAHVQAPDGSIFHIEWTLLDGVHFQDLATVEGIEERGSWSKQEDEDFQSHFPDLQRATYERLKLEHDPIYDEISDLEQQWKAWRASQTP